MDALTTTAINTKNVPLMQVLLRNEQDALEQANRRTDAESLAAYWYGYGCNEQECKARIVALTDALLNT